MLSAVLLVVLGAVVALLVSAGIFAYLARRPAGGLRGRRRSRGRAQHLREIVAFAGTLDLDEVIARVLAAAVASARADGAAVSLDRGPAPFVKTLHLAPEDAMPILNEWSRSKRARALTTQYRPETDAESSKTGVRSAVALPIVGLHENVLGTLALYWRQPTAGLSDSDLGVIEDLAESAGRAIETAQRFAELRELAARDPLSGLFNRRYFDETLSSEVNRAHRYDRQLALIFFDVDDFKAINERLGYLGADRVLADVAEVLDGVVRAADTACRIGGDEFAVILPEATLEEAEHLFHRLQSTIQDQPVASEHQIRVSAGVAELRQDDTEVTLFERADQALSRAKSLGKARVVAADDSV